MELPRSGIEYATWTLTADVDLDGTPQVAVTLGYPDEADWINAAWVDAQVVSGDTRTRKATLLLAGPVAPSPGDATVLPVRRTYQSWARLADTPEVIVRATGSVTVT